LEEESQRQVCAAFEQAAKSEGKEVGEDKRDDSGDRALRANEGLDHRHSILPTNRQWNKGRQLLRQSPNLRISLQVATQASTPRIARKTAEVRLPLFVRVNFRWLLVFR
jgi:hypothetical protein